MNTLLHALNNPPIELPLNWNASLSFPDELPEIEEPPKFLVPPSKSPNKKKKVVTSANSKLDTNSLSKYLDRKYRELLFSNIPAIHFSKTVLLKIPQAMASGEDDELLKLLATRILDLTQFDKRHAQISQVLSKGEPAEDCLNSKELESLNQFGSSQLKEHWDIRSGDTENQGVQQRIRDKLENIGLYLKIREAQLQFVLLTKYITGSGDIESLKRLLEDSDVLIAQSAPRRTLIRPKKGQKFKPETLQEMKKDAKYYKSLLSGYLDRFLIWDILIETKKADLEDHDALNDENLVSPVFLKRAVIPLFYKETPHLMKFMRNKLSGAIMAKARPREVKHTSEKTEEPEPKKLRRAITLALSGLPSSRTLKKTNSVGLLSNTKHLNRREVDLSLNKPKKAISHKSLHAALAQFSASEQVLKKPNITKTKTVIERSVSQIEATPMKDKSQNPYNNFTGFKRSLNQNLTQISEMVDSIDSPYSTPTTNRFEEIISPEVEGAGSRLDFATPSKSRIKNLDENESTDEDVEVEVNIEDKKERDEIRRAIFRGI